MRSGITDICGSQASRSAAGAGHFLAEGLADMMQRAASTVQRWEER